MAEPPQRPDPPAVDEDVPRLPRGRGITLSRPQLVRILGMVAVLVVLLVMQQPCSSAVSTFVTGFGSQGSGATPGPHAGSGSASTGAGGASAGGSAAGSDELPLEQYEHLRPDMTEAEVKAVMERARLKAAGSGAAP